jgi:hypothetical protein
MSEEVKNFVDALANANNDQAGEAFKDALRAKVGDALDNQRKELAGNLFNAQPFSDPKPEIADAGTFNQDGTIASAQNDGEAEIDLSKDNNEDQ